MTPDIYLSGYVSRFHANPSMAHLGQQDSSHQWGCLAILMYLHPNPSKELILGVAFHDIGELRAGDLPYPFKRAHPKISEEHAAIEHEYASDMFRSLNLTIEDKQWLHLVDMMEPILFAELHNPSILKKSSWKSMEQWCADESMRLGVYDKAQLLMKAIEETQ